MKHFSILGTLLLFAFLAQAQKEALPEEYHFQHDALKKRQATEPGDIHLDPIELIPLEPSSFSIQNQGNWGYNYLEMDKFEDQVEARADRPVVVFIFDTAGDYDHPALNGVEWQAKHRVFTGEDPSDGNGHSTHVASSIAGTATGQRIGIAEPLVKAGKIRLVAYKVLRNSGSGFISDIVRAIEVADEEAKTLIQEGYFVVYNFSLGAQTKLSQFDQALNNSEDIGVFIAAASGNSNQELIGSPANGPSAHAVAALDENGSPATFSNRGPEQYIAAPGVRIYGAYPNNQYRELSGTSMATPHIAGVVAMIASINPTATARQISHYLRRHSLDIFLEGWDSSTGWGTPVASKWIADDPTQERDESNGNPNTPNPDPEPEPEPEPIRTRKIVHIIEGVQLNWKPIDESEWQTAQLRLELEIKSKNSVNFDNKLLRIQAIEFFFQNGILVPSEYDMHEAAAWGAHFFEDQLRKNKVPAEVDQLRVYKDAIEVKVNRSSRFSEGIKKIFNPELRVVNF